jgi:hypothetical protein
MYISGVWCGRVTFTTVPLIDAKSRIKNHLHGIKTQVPSVVVIQDCMCTLISNGIHEQVATVPFLAMTRDFILQHLIVCGVLIRLVSGYTRLPKSKGEHTSLSSAQLGLLCHQFSHMPSWHDAEVQGLYCTLFVCLCESCIVQRVTLWPCICDINAYMFYLYDCWGSHSSVCDERCVQGCVWSHPRRLCSSWLYASGSIIDGNYSYFRMRPVKWTTKK